MPGLHQPPRELTWADGLLVKARIRSTLTGTLNEMEFDTRFQRAITIDQYNRWQSGVHIQNAMPQLSDEEREFLLTGATPEEWDAEFGGEDE